MASKGMFGDRVWMVPPSRPDQCPAGLEYLTVIDKLICNQLIEVLEVLTGIETNNRYILTNSLGQPCYYAVERSSLVQRLAAGPEREFVINILDNAGTAVARIFRPYKACGGFCWGLCGACSRHEVVVEAPVGTVVARVAQIGTCCKFTAGIQSATSGGEYLIVQGPGCNFSIAECTFPVKGKQGNMIGGITRHYQGFVKQAIGSDADTFSMTFPLDLEPGLKLGILACTFLIDFMFYEEKQKPEESPAAEAMGGANINVNIEL